MDPLNGRADPTPKDLQGQISLCSPMGPCFVQQTTHSTLKNEDWRGMAPYASCMPRVSVIAAAVSCVSTVKNVEPPRSNRDG